MADQHRVSWWNKIVICLLCCTLAAQGKLTLCVVALTINCLIGYKWRWSSKDR